MGRKDFHAEREGRAGVGEASLRRRLGASFTENIRTAPLGDDPEWPEVTLSYSVEA